METILVSYLVGIVAGVTANYICKWLDNHSKNDN